MNSSVRTLIAVVVPVCASCATPESPSMDPEGSELNVRFVRALNDAAVKNAILTQHTLYPYHFIPNSDQLNELGEKDLRVLTEYYINYPGTLNMHRGGIPPALYQARVATVADAMVQAGVDNQRVTVADAMPGGDGMASQRVAVVIKDAHGKVTQPSNPRPTPTPANGGRP